MNYKNTSLERYLNDLAAKIPAPGGGSAGGFTAAGGGSFISIGGDFSLGKPK